MCWLRTDPCRPSSLFPSDFPGLSLSCLLSALLARVGSAFQGQWCDLLASLCVTCFHSAQHIFLHLPAFVDFTGIFHSIIFGLLFLPCFYSLPADRSLQNISMKPSGEWVGSGPAFQDQVWEDPCRKIFQKIMNSRFKCNTSNFIFIILNNSLSEMHFILICLLEQSGSDITYLFLNSSGHLHECYLLL